jgi:hypothetical protein
MILLEFINRNTKGSFATAAVVLGFVILMMGAEHPVCAIGGSVIFAAGVISLLFVLYFQTRKFAKDSQSKQGNC